MPWPSYPIPDIVHISQTLIRPPLPPIGLVPTCPITTIRQTIQEGIWLFWRIFTPPPHTPINKRRRHHEQINWQSQGCRLVPYHWQSKGTITDPMPILPRSDADIQRPKRSKVKVIRMYLWIPQMGGRGAIRRGFRTLSYLRQERMLRTLWQLFFQLECC